MFQIGSQCATSPAEEKMLGEGRAMHRQQIGPLRYPNLTGTQASINHVNGKQNFACTNFYRSQLNFSLQCSASVPSSPRK